MKIEKSEKLIAKMYPIRNTLSEIYREYWNDYLTISKWAEHKGIPEECARELMPILRKIREAHVTEIKQLELEK